MPKVSLGSSCSQRLETWPADAGVDLGVVAQEIPSNSSARLSTSWRKKAQSWRCRIRMRPKQKIPAEKPSITPRSGSQEIPRVGEPTNDGKVSAKRVGQSPVTT